MSTDSTSPQTAVPDAGGRARGDTPNDNGQDNMSQALATAEAKARRAADALYSHLSELRQQQDKNLATLDRLRSEASAEHDKALPTVQTARQKHAKQRTDKALADYAGAAHHKRDALEQFHVASEAAAYGRAGKVPA